jgi:hypothetical protein
MKPLGILAILAGGVLLFFGAVVGFDVGLGIRVMNLPALIVGGVLFLAGVILFSAGSQNTESLMYPTERTVAYDRNKWNALVKYDDEIALIANKLKPLGQRWVDEFASSYLALDDKRHLPNLIRKIITDARNEADLPPLEGQQNLDYELTQKSIDILREAKANGYEVELDAKEKSVVVRKRGIEGTWYLGSNEEIDNFGKETGLA